MADYNPSTDTIDTATAANIANYSLLGIDAGQTGDSQFARWSAPSIVNAGLSGVTAGVSLNDQTISRYSAAINLQTGTTYTLALSDNGKIVELSNASTITLTLPSTLPAGFGCWICQAGAGQVQFSGTTIRNRFSHNKLAGQWSEASVRVRSNSGGSAAEYVISGDTDS